MPFTGARSLVYVNVAATFPLKYGFLTNTTAANQTALGHTAVADKSTEVGLVVGANSPKPGRASKARATGIDTSFYDFGQKATLIAAGWKLTSPRRRFSKSGTRSKIVYVLHEGNKIAWYMPTSTHTAIASDMAGLGILDTDGTENDLIFGVSYPKLPKVKNETTTPSRITHCDPSKVDSLPAGWVAGAASGTF